MSPELSHWTGGLRVGGEFFERRGAVVRTDAPPRGVVDRIADLAHPGIDVSRVHPSVVAFFEDTAGLDLTVRSRWRFPFSWAWRAARPLMRAVGQLVLPLRESEIVTRAYALAEGRDGRPKARAIVRTYRGTSEVMQVIAYATRQVGDARYMSAAFPLPGGHLLGVLRLDAIEDASGGAWPIAVALTSQRRRGDATGVWLVLGRLAIRSPFGERLELWPPGMKGAPDLDLSRLPGVTILGRHTQTFFGVRLVTHDYWFRPREEAAAQASPQTTSVS